MSPALHISELPRCVRGWLASEKFDGIRALWDGEDFLSRSGRVLNVPQWFREGMPRVKLDGELWLGRGTFGSLLSAIQRKGGDWSGVQYMIFETRNMKQPVEARIAAVRALSLPAWCVPVEHRALRSHAELDAMERRVVRGGGEGLVIRRPGSLYRPGRAGDVVKVKRLVGVLDRWQG